MSAFSTEIPVDIDAVKKLLPEGSDIEGIDWDKDRKSVTLRWSNRRYQTPFTFCLPFSQEQLRDGAVPKEVTLKAAPPAKAEAAAISVEAPPQTGNSEKTTTFSVKGLTVHKGKRKQVET